MALVLKPLIFELSDLTQIFDQKRILDIQQLSFEAGKIYCLYGPNGSGKTTLFEVLTLLRKPANGRIPATAERASVERCAAPERAPRRTAGPTTLVSSVVAHEARCSRRMPVLARLII